MKSTADFLNDLRAHFGVPSDNKLAPAMGWERQQVSRYRLLKQTFDDRTAIRVAGVLGIEPDHVLACMAAQRAIPESRPAWERIAAKVAAVLVMGAVGLGASLHNQTVRAGTSTPENGPDYTYAPNRRRRLLRRAQAALSALGRCLGLALALASCATPPDPCALKRAGDECHIYTPDPMAGQGEPAVVIEYHPAPRRP